MSRDASVDAARAERRRIERDLHDGAQQRLVALAMDLGLAKERLERGDDPAGTAELVGQAHDEAKRAITELRELVRGIHPAVLTDRGLDAALSVGRRPLPGAGRPSTSICPSARRRPSRRPPTSWWPRRSPTWPSTAAPRQRAASRVDRRGPTLVVEVTDDGLGGAVGAARRRAGRSGDRVAAVEGTPAPGQPARAGRPPLAGGAPVRVVIAEDSVLLREGLARILAEYGDEVVAALGDADDARRRPSRPPRPDLVDRRRAHAADAHRRGPARRHRAARACGRARRCWCCRSTSRSATPAELLVGATRQASATC